MFKMFFPSPRNSIEAYVSLLDETACTHFIVPAEEPPIVATILQKRPLPKLNIPDLEVLLDGSPVDEVVLHKTFDEARMEPFLILHTSGSTGIPKAITIRHGYTTTMDAYQRFKEGSEVVRRAGSRRVFNPFPPFHMAGIMWSLPIVCWVDSTIVFPPPVPLTAKLADEIHKHTHIDYSTLMPSIIIELAKNEESLQRLAKLESLSFAGGPLPKATGDKISQLTTIHASYGSTEMMAPPVIEKKPENWQYLRFDTEHSGIEFRRTAPDVETHELVIVRKKELELVQAIFATFPELDEYKTKDMFTPHPSEPGHWLYAGRLDDIIVFSNGEKLNPVTMEGAITSGSPDITGCLVIGQGRFQSALLVEAKEPPENESEQRQMIDEIWPVVQRANRSGVKHGRVAKDFILFTTADKPFPRAGKGTIQRQRALDLYKETIDDFYSGQQNSRSRQGSGDKRIDLSTAEATEHTLQVYFENDLGLEDVSPDEDIFRYGVDSLQVMELVKAINNAAGGSQVHIEPKQIYENPTIEKLAQALHSDAKPRLEDDDDMDAWTEMQQTFHDVTSRLLHPRHRPISQPEPPRLELRHIRESASLHSPNSETTVVNRISAPKESEKAPMISTTGDNYIASEDTDFLISMIPPDGGWNAWTQVLASFLINFNTFGLVNAFGDYQAFYETEYLSSYSGSDISWIGTVQAALLLLVGVLSGPIFDKGYFTITLRVSSIVLVFAWMMLSLADQYYQMMLSQGILAGLCVGLLYIPSVALIPLYFKDRRGLALGLALSGAPIGGIIYSVVFRAALTNISFGWATRIVAFIVLATLAAANILIRPLDHIQIRTNANRQFLDLKAFREIPFTFFFIAAFMIYCAWLIPYFLTPRFALTLGTDSDTATYLIAVLNAAQFFGRVIPAWLSDKYGGAYMLFLAEIATAILGFSWITIATVGGFVEFQIFYGFVSGMVATLPAVVVPYVCPSLAVLGTRMGMIYAAAGVGVLIGNPVALATMGNRGERRDFLGPQLWMGVCAAVGAGFFVITVVRAEKQRKGVESVKEEKPGPLEDLRTLVRRRKKTRV